MAPTHGDTVLRSVCLCLLVLFLLSGVTVGVLKYSHENLYHTGHTLYTNVMTHDVTAGRLGIRDICPGVDYILTQTSTDSTVVQVNVSDCRNDLPGYTSRQGVVYGVCDNAASFCKLYIRDPQYRKVRALVQRHEYWCKSRHWKMTISKIYWDEWGTNLDLSLQCDSYSLDTLFVGMNTHLLLIENIHSPPVSVVIETVKREDFIVNNVTEYSGYIIAPYVGLYPGTLFFCTEWRVPSSSVIMISVQQLPSNGMYCYHSIGSSLYNICRIKLLTSEPNAVRQREKAMLILYFTIADILFTPYLRIQFYSRYRYDYHSGLKMYLSPLSVNDQHIKLTSGLFNCSVNRYPTFQQHMDCNLKPQCEDGRDETEHCPHSSPHCQGLVASRNKCFQEIFIEKGIPVMLSEYECQKIGGRLASIITRKEQVDFLKGFKNYFEFMVTVGLKTGWFKSVTFVHRKFCTWPGNTLIYNINHYRSYLCYTEGRIIWNIKSMKLRSSFAVAKSKSILCEVRLQPEIVFNSGISLTHINSAALVFNSTQQSLSVCRDSSITHTFLSCDSDCSYLKYSKTCNFVNASDAQLASTFFIRRQFTNTDTLFTCDDLITTVPQSLVCDFRPDCSDGTDESFCEYPSCTGFFCFNGQCVARNQHCNQYSDCLDDSDESGCKMLVNFVYRHKTLKEQSFYYVILDGTGYFTQQLMVKDESCPQSHFRCQSESRYCLPVYSRCNGFSDCIYGEDERDCDTAACPGFYRCRSSTVCVHWDHLCDGWGQCPQRDDELLCDMTCSEGCLCQDYVFLCNKPFLPDLFPQLRYVDAMGSQMQLADFSRNFYIVHLSLSHCFLHNISAVKLLNLKHINLANNYLNNVHVAVLLALPNLESLRLENNPLGKVSGAMTKHIHYSLKHLDLSETRLNLFSSLSLYLPDGIFLNMSFCGIETIGLRGFRNIPRLKDLDMTGNPIIKYPLDLLARSNNLERIFSSNFRFCCENVLPKHFSKIKCFTPHSILPSCAMLLPTELYRGLFWLTGALAIIGNLLCFVASSAVEKVSSRTFVILIVHLKCANIFMGGQVSIVVLADHVFYGKYLHFEKGWTNNVTCKIAGFMFLLSSVVSVLMICFINMYHIIVLCFPNQLWRFNKCFSAFVCTGMWAVGCLLALIPFLPGLAHWGLQNQSGLCRLALFQNYHSKQDFKWFTVIVTVNCIWSVVSVAGQAIIYRRTPKYRIALSTTQRSVFSSVYVMEKVVVTNAVCWFAFGLTALMSSRGVAVFDSIHDSMVVFVLPINPALHPFLYLWTAYRQWQKQQQEETLIKLFKARLVKDRKH